MAKSYKLLRIEPIGAGGQTAFVCILEDTTDELRLTTVTGIPAHLSPANVLAWLQANFTIGEGWMLGHALEGREKEFWLILWNYSDTITTLEGDVDDCNDDIADIPTADLAGLRVVLVSIVTRQRRLINIAIKIIKVIARLLKVHAPQEQEASSAEE